MEQIPCPNCAAPLSEHATFCLACDTPVPGKGQGLSVSVPTPVLHTRPNFALITLAVIIVAVVIGGYAIWNAIRPDQAKQASKVVGNGVSLIVRAESGHRAACKSLPSLVAGVPATIRLRCRAIVGHEPGVEMSHASERPADLHGASGSVQMQATVADGTASHHFTEKFIVQKQSGKWRLSWGGTPIP